MRQTTLDLNGPFLSFTQNPIGITTSNGGTVVLTGIATATFISGVSADSPTAPVNPATGTGSISYRWYEVGVGELIDNARISGSGTTTLTLSNLTTPIDSGRQFYLTADYVPSAYQSSSPVTAGTARSTGNALNEPISSGIATITINPLLEIIAQPSNRNTLVNQNTTFNINASLTNNSNDISYQWYLDGAPVNDGTLTKQTASSTTIAAFDLYSTPRNFLKADLPLNATTNFSDTSPNSATVVNYADGGAITIQPAQSKYYTASARKPIISPQSSDFRESHININTGAGSAFRTNDFCIEAWVYPENFDFGGLGAMDFCFPRARNGGATDIAIGVVPYIRIEGSSVVYYSGTYGNPLISKGGLIANQWNHIAVVRNQQTIYVYVNGVSTYGGYFYQQPADNTDFTGIEYWMFASIRTFTAGFYMQNIRIYSGIAKYSAGETFTPVNEIQPFLKVALPLNSDFGITDKSSLITGSSSATRIFNYSDGGTITIQNTRSKFYNSSARKPIEIPRQDTFKETWIGANTGAGSQIGRGDFTIEAWIYSEDFNYAGPGQIFSFLYSPHEINYSPFGTNPNGYVPRIVLSGGSITLQSEINNTNETVGVSGMQPNTWHHVAITRKNGVIGAFLDGRVVRYFVGGNPLNYTGIEYWFLASTRNFTSGFFINDLRLYVGVAKYSGLLQETFTPPGSLFTYKISQSSSFTNDGTLTLPSTASNIQITVAGAKGGRGGDDSGGSGGGGADGRQGRFTLGSAAAGKTLTFKIGKRGNDGPGCFGRGSNGGTGVANGGRGGNASGCSGTGGGGGGATGVGISQWGGNIIIAAGGGGGGGGAWERSAGGGGAAGSFSATSNDRMTASDGGAGADSGFTGLDGSGGGGGGAGLSGGGGGGNGRDKSFGASGGGGGTSAYYSGVATLQTESTNPGDGFVNITYDYITDDSTVATSLVNQNVYLSGTKTPNLTIRSDYATVQNVYCLVSSSSASNSPLTSNTVTFASLPTADEATINIESIGTTSTANVTSVNLNNGDFEFSGFSSKPSAGVSINYVSLYSPNRDINVEMDLYGGKGVDVGSNPGGEGGFSRIRFTMERNVEYVIEGVNSNVNTPYVYRKGKLIATVGQGGSAGVSGKGGFGGGIGVAGQDGTGRLAGTGGVAYKPSELPSTGVLGSLTSLIPTAPDTKALQPFGGRTLPCTKGIYWQQQGVAPCNDVGTTQFRLPDGTVVSNTASISRGYKAGYNIIQTAGRGIEGGNGGNGASGGIGGQSGAGGGGGAGYGDGSAILVSSALGGSAGDSKIVLRVSSSAAGIPLSTPTFEYLIVGGGGGGGSYQSGGGGAGGFLTGSVNQYVQFLTITVGNGGAGAVGDNSASNGQNSSIIGGSAVNLIAFGGGRGGNYGQAGADGGSGGGGGPRDGSPFFFPGGNSQSGQGNRGGQGFTGSPPYPGGGGGGGAGSAGGDKTSSFSAAGNGGSGRESSITGTAIIYAGGGGAGQYYDPFTGQPFVGGGSGGVGGGGEGGIQYGVGNTIYRLPSQGTDGLGGGGGAGGANQNGARGGRGIVVIRYPISFPAAITTGNVQYNVVGQNRIYIWSGDGTLTFV